MRTPLATGLRFHFQQASSIERDVGMLTAQMVINSIGMNKSNSLKFELHNQDYEAYFNALITPDDDPAKAIEFWDRLGDNGGVVKAVVEEKVADSIETQNRGDNESLDSDDLEFEPFDWTDESRSKYAPKYILEAADILSGSGVGITI